MLERNAALEKKCTHQLLTHTELSCTTVDPLYLCRTTRPTATTKRNSFGLGLLVAQKTDYESADDVWAGVLSPNSAFPGLSTAHYTYSETELRLYSQPLQRVTTEDTHLTGRQVDYPVFLSLPLTWSNLALATGEIPTEWLIVHYATCGLTFKALCCTQHCSCGKVRRTFRSTPLSHWGSLLCGSNALRLLDWSNSTEDTSATPMWMQLVLWILNWLTEKLSQVRPSRLPTHWRTLPTHFPRGWMALATAMLIVVFFLGTCHWPSSKWRRLGLPALQLNWRSSPGITTMALELPPCQSLRLALISRLTSRPADLECHPLTLWSLWRRATEMTLRGSEFRLLAIGVSTQLRMLKTRLTVFAWDLELAL